MKRAYIKALGLRPLGVSGKVTFNHLPPTEEKCWYSSKYGYLFMMESTGSSKGNLWSKKPGDVCWYEWCNPDIDRIVGRLKGRHKAHPYPRARINLKTGEVVVLGA